MSILLTTLFRMIASRQPEISLGKTSHQWYVADSSTIEWISFCGIQKTSKTSLAEKTTPLTLAGTIGWFDRVAVKRKLHYLGKI